MSYEASTVVSEDLLNLTFNQTTTEWKYKGHEAVLIAIATTTLIFLSVAGNLLVVIAVFTERHMRKTTNFFYVSLALADMLVATMVMTFAAANDILGYWPIDAMFCSVWLSFDIMGSTASILNLCTISMDRYIHIKFPLRYEACMTPRLTLAIISAVWICSALISFVPIHLGWHSDSTSSTIGSEHSGVFHCYLSLNSTYAIVSSCVSFYVPCAVMIFIYYRMYRYAQKHVKIIKRTTCSDNDHHQPSDQKAAITLGVIMGTFLFCWFPFFTMNVIAGFCQSCVSNELFVGLTWLGYINSALNPIIYSIFNKEFRRAFYKILCVKMCCCKERIAAMKQRTNHSSSMSYRSQNETGNMNGTSVRKPLNPKPV